MIKPSPGDPILYCVDGGLTCHDDDNSSHGGDIPIKGWMTTETKNSYGQIVRSSTFDWKDGLTLWNGRILDSHGQRFFIGGGNNTPTGMMTSHEIIDGEGMLGTGYIFEECSAQYLRSIREGTINALSIGFTLMKKGYEYDEDTDTLEITKGQLHEVSTCNVGANLEARFAVLNSFNHERNVNPNYLHGYIYVIMGGERYLVNEQGDIIDA